MVQSGFEICLFISVVCFCFVNQVSCQCTFGSTFAGTAWHDNTKGTLTFTTTGMSGWSFTSIRDAGSTTTQQWQCVNHTNDNYLVLRTQSTFLFQSVSTTVFVYGYLCLQLTSVTAVSFIYYQAQVQELNLGGERIKVSDLSTLTQNDVCDTSVTVPVTEYHVLVKSGSEADAAIQCPDALLFRADYTYIANDGTLACTGTSDTWNVCTDKTKMTFDYNTCSQEIAFSAEGNFYCVASVQSNGYAYTTIYNRDATISASTNRFACMSFGGGSASVAPGNCTAHQTPSSFPLEADQQTKVGHKLLVTNVYEDCGIIDASSTGLSSGAIAGIVISVLLIIWMWTWTIIAIVILFFVYRIVVVCLLELSGITDYTPRRKGTPVLSMTDDIQDAKTKAVLDSIKVTSPSTVMLNGKTNGDSPKIHTSVDNKLKIDKQESK